MGNGYTRNDTADNIADGNIINASDLDGEFDAVQAAFDNSTGHTHDGTDGEGAPIDRVGPAQDIVVTATALRPKTNNTVDLGVQTTNEFKNLYIDGTAYLDSVDIDGGTIDGTVIGGTTAAAGSFTTGSFTGDATFGDNDKAIFGAGSDLQIYSTGANGFIENNSGLLILKNNSDDRDIALQSDDGAGGIANYLLADGSTGALKIYHYGAEKLATTSQGVDVTGTLSVEDAVNYTGSSNFYIRSRLNGGNVHIGTETTDGTLYSPIVINGTSDTLKFANQTGDVMWITSTGNVGIGNAAPATALDVTGTITSDGLTVSGNGTFTNTTAAEAGLTVSGAEGNGWGLEIATHNAGTASDLVLSGNAVVGHETSVSYTIPTSGYYRWMAGATSNTGGTAGSSEIMRLTDAGNITVTGDATINSLTFGRGAGSVTSNTASGLQALFNNTTGSSNTASGHGALHSNTTGANNTASGRDALRNNTTGNSNTASGRDALESNTTGSSNTASGFQVLFNNTTGSFNVASGHQALYVNTTGSSNTASGYQALRSNTTGFSNTASGYQALYSNTTGANNTASGYQALRSNTTGFHNTASGYQALESNTAGTYNTASGYQALESNTTGASNTAAGHQALENNTTGFGNTANGREALHSNTTGNSNTASGREALYSNITGFGNAASGHQALYSNTTGGSNAAIGLQALYGNTTGSANTASGYQALYSNTTGSFNAAIGREALRNNTTGAHNTASGYQALYSNTTGSFNAAIGRDALYSNTTGSNNTASGYLALQSNTTGDNNTAVGMQTLKDTTTGLGNLGLAFRTGAAVYSPVFNPTTENNRIVMGHTSITNAYVQVAWTVVSDARDKTAFSTVPHGLDFVNSLKPTEYQFKENGRGGEADGIKRYGFLAQDVLELEGDNPVIVDTEDLDKLKLKESNLIPVLVNAIQELSAEVQTLKAKLENT